MPSLQTNELIAQPPRDAAGRDGHGPGPMLFGVQCWLKKIYRQGPRFQHHARELERTGRLSAEALKAHEDTQLHAMVAHCYQNVPYYRDLFKQLGLEPRDIQRREDLVKLPMLDKRTVRENFDKLISPKHQNFLCQTATTSGTTGTPSRFIRDYDAINFEHAAIWRNWRAAGDDGKRRISLRGDLIVPASHAEPPFWRYNPANRELQMSSYHLSQANSVHYIEKILAFQPRILYCGPSMGYVLAKFFAFAGVDYTFDAVFTSSESLEPEVRNFIEKTFHTRIFDWYGQAERVAAIGQCSHGTYHIQEDYSIVETMPGPNGSIELVGTQLRNRVMPLLRYRTGDYVMMQEGASRCACGSHFRSVDRILGRSYGYLLTPEGYHIAITAHIPTGVDNLIEAQFLQEREGEVILNVVTNGRFTERDRSRLIDNTQKHTSPRMKVIVREVDNIPRGPNGKFVNIINNLQTQPLQ